MTYLEASSIFGTPDAIFENLCEESADSTLCFLVNFASVKHFIIPANFWFLPDLWAKQRVPRYFGTLIAYPMAARDVVVGAGNHC